MGKISQEWLTLYSKMCPQNEGEKRVDSVQWSRKVVEHILRSVINFGSLEVQSFTMRIVR